MKSYPATTGLLVLTVAVLAASHGDEHSHGKPAGEHGHTDMHHASKNTTSPSVDTAKYYFEYPEHKGWLYLHILAMMFGWVVIMPISTMLSIAGSRYHATVQAAFLAVNAIGMGFSIIYSGLTPDLYPENSHSKMGWALALILAAQTIIGVVTAVVRRSTKVGWNSMENMRFMPVPTQSPTGSNPESRHYRHSRDSGHGDSFDEEDAPVLSDLEESDDWHNEVTEKKSGSRWGDLTAIERILSAKAPFVFNNRVVRLGDFFYSLIARFLIPLAFTQISLGVVTGGGIFMGDAVFNGLAHFIKGGIFCLYGFFTLGRWLGAFADIGWAWNVKPPDDRSPSTRLQQRAPTAEGVESGLIFIYGCANVFLEHLAGWGGEWSHSDLQHVSIAFMFFGGGLLGLLIESKRIRDFLSGTVSKGLTLQQPISNFSFNPVPALVIFVLGILMSQHHQHSKLSTVIHTQWGALLAGGAAFRLATYLLFFRSPPTAVLPSRPPTEVIAAFCLISGGFVFMTSNKDTVAYLERIGVDAMFTLTVTVGITALLMSWTMIVMAVKGWAFKREQGRGEA